MWLLELFRENKHKIYYLILAIVLLAASLIFEGGVYLWPTHLLLWLSQAYGSINRHLRLVFALIH